MSEGLFVAGAVALVTLVAGPMLRRHLEHRGRAAAARDVLSLRWPFRAWGAALVARSLVPEDAGDGPLRLLAVGALVLTSAWLLLRLLDVGVQVLFRRLSIDVADNLRARSRRTQLELLRRIVAVVVVIGAAFVALVTMTPLGRLGPTIVAYAGLIGVVLGMALRAPIENLAAGVVVAVNEPVRIDDVVVVEGEWGRIEQVGLTNVVVRVWDDRRLVLPTSRFVNEPFENWTRRSAALTGTVHVWVSHECDITAVRSEAERLVAASPLWDRRVCKVQVVELERHAVNVRVLVTASNAGAAFDLRCHVREGLQRFLAEHPAWLPELRTSSAAAVA